VNKVTREGRGGNDVFHWKFPKEHKETALRVVANKKKKSVSAGKGLGKRGFSELVFRDGGDNRGERSLEKD